MIKKDNLNIKVEKTNGYYYFRNPEKLSKQTTVMQLMFENNGEFAR